jgi:hypothetical protein
MHIKLSIKVVFDSFFSFTAKQSFILWFERILNLLFINILNNNMLRKLGNLVALAFLVLVLSASWVRAETEEAEDAEDYGFKKDFVKKDLVLFSHKGWYPGGETFIWGKEVKCIANNVLKIDTGFYGGGCGQFYYTKNNNKLLDLDGYRYLTVELRSNVPVKLEYERGTTKKVAGFKVAKIIPSTNYKWVTVTLKRLSEDIAENLYSPLLVTGLEGKGFVEVKSLVASKFPPKDYYDD